MKKLTPRTAKSFTEVCKLKRDNVDSANHWILLDLPEIIICAQRNGQESTSQVVLTRREFNKFVDWYNGVTYSVNELNSNEL